MRQLKARPRRDWTIAQPAVPDFRPVRFALEVFFWVVIFTTLSYQLGNVQIGVRFHNYPTPRPYIPKITIQAAPCSGRQDDIGNWYGQHICRSIPPESIRHYLS